MTYFGHSHESPGKETHLDFKLKNLIGVPDHVTFLNQVTWGASKCLRPGTLVLVKVIRFDMKKTNWSFLHSLKSSLIQLVLF